MDEQELLISVYCQRFQVSRVCCIAYTPNKL